MLLKAFKNVLNPNVNPLRYAPAHIKYFASILLSCFWCLAFGLYVGSFFNIAYNMMGHVAVISMAFATWAVFKVFDRVYNPNNRGVNWLRQPDRSSRCDELTDEQREELAKKL